MRRTTTILLTIVALLLGLNLARPQADAQPGEIEFIPVVRLVSLSIETGFAFRLWSDGLVESRRYEANPDLIGRHVWHETTPVWAEVTDP